MWPIASHQRLLLPRSQSFVASKSFLKGLGGECLLWARFSSFVRGCPGPGPSEQSLQANQSQQYNNEPRVWTVAPQGQINSFTHQDNCS